MQDEGLKQFIAAFDLKSPRVVDEIDSVLARLLKFRDFAADLHGIAKPSPMASAAPQASTESSGARRVSIETIAALVDQYRSDERSQYHQLRHRTRENYESLIKRILADFGARRLAELKREDFERIYERWKDGTKVAMAHALITMLRSMVTFGATVIEDSECLRLSVVLHRMKFEMVRPRSERQRERLSVKHVLDIRREAHKQNRPSVALAQALQYEGRLAQKDVIGEWVPHTEPGTMPSDVLDEGMKWVRGIRWNQIDEYLVLRHVTSAKQEKVAIDLSQCPMVMEELRAIARCKPNEKLSRAKLQRAARPIIVNEDTSKPYLTHTWRRTWRKIATDAGVPKEIENRESRMASGVDAAPAEQSEEIAG